tara:strand:- start:12940 stop:13878 length:939 start_codon:yes stop_codon:yes gene_type:complete
MFLKQSTAYTFRFGPFLDDSDGKTAETGLTISQADIRLSKNGGNFAQKNESSASSHDEIGYYIVVLDTTDTNTCGELLVACHESGALPVFKTFYVLEEAIYDAMFAASADLITKVDAIDTVVDSILVDTGTTLDGKLDTIDGIVDAILVDTNELQGDWTNGGRLDLILDATLADTNELQADWANGGRLDLIIDAILVDTAEIGSAGAGLTAVPWNSSWDAEVQSECTDALNAYDPPTKAEMDATWTTAQTESYASDGAAATPAQLLYMIYCAVGEFSVSSTTITGKKLDGSTTAMTWTINDASNPTSRTRAS